MQHVTANQTQAAPQNPARPAGRDAELRDRAVQLESFLFAELLRVSGTGTPSPGGAGESQFDSFLRQAQAEAVAASGQTGLAEAIHRALAKSAAGSLPVTNSAEAAAGT